MDAYKCIHTSIYVHIDKYICTGLDCCKAIRVGWPESSLPRANDLQLRSGGTLISACIQVYMLILKYRCKLLSAYIQVHRLIRAYIQVYVH